LEEEMSGRLRRSDRRGFTLVELMIASAILAILIISVGFFLTQIIERSDMVDDMTKALELCRQGIEQYRTLDLSSMSGSVSDTIDGNFYRTITLSEPYTEYQDAKLVVCEVEWDGIGGRDSLSLSTIY
jgi:prepilin-type N-terminal cleavage/methylation domain-containing protein